MIKTMRRYPLAPAGQRQNPIRALLRLQILLVFALIATPAFSKPEADPAFRMTQLKMPSRVVSIGEAHGLVFACLGLEGVAWFPADRATTESIVYRAEWPTLNVWELPEGRALLCGRDAKVRIVHVTGEGEIEFLYDWESEGLCNAAAVRGRTLAIAGGGAGVNLWDWPDQTKPPRQVGRYPFNDYTKRVHFLSDNVLIAADNFDTGLLVLDPSDPIRPKAHSVFNVHGFCDSAAAAGNVIFATDRVRGTHVLRLGDDPAEIVHAGYIPRLVPLDGRAIVQHVTARGDDVLIAEGNAGLRWWRPADNELGWREAAVFGPFGNVVEGIFLGPGRIAAADFDDGVVIIEFNREAVLAQGNN